MSVNESRITHDLLIQHFGLDPSLYVFQLEIIQRKDHPEKFDIAKKEYESNLAGHPKRADIAAKLYVGDQFIAHLTGSYLKSEIEGLSENGKFFYPICTRQEIARIEAVSNVDDYLLKLRAETVVDDPRLARIFLKRRDSASSSWSLTSYYDSYDFEEYIDYLSAEHASECRNISYGYVLSRDPHGVCINTSFGKVVVLSEALRHFLFYMNAYFKGQLEGLDGKDTQACLLIACRTMLLTESQDFDLDPRGELPPQIRSYCNALVEDQVKFIIGHEFAHALLGHFGSAADSTSNPELFSVSRSGHCERFYTPRQYQEFEADAGSILHADYSDQGCSSILNAAVLFFLYLDLFYAVSDYINPPFNPSNTHPDPIERIKALRKTVLEARTADMSTLYSEQDVEDWIKWVSNIKDFLVSEVLPFEIDEFERYGSVYLPSYRTEVLFDRFDF
ncbi:hypothetical protein [Pseudomonas sp. CFBP 13719]|uniref:hypothetical protein n=1 Tax=Pseudomonas sp. CFBP 13719 TaxID=2775303 RepID=UPI00177B2686|nr:hypothetical protein [Pseudomonas sp. CFBP 13719]MBD8683955.1 hypothetical protein [Pseudomonas sp. CFBP 13719]